MSINVYRYLTNVAIYIYIQNGLQAMLLIAKIKKLLDIFLKIQPDGKNYS